MAVAFSRRFGEGVPQRVLQAIGAIGRPRFALYFIKHAAIFHWFTLRKQSGLIVFVGKQAQRAARMMVIPA